MKVQFRVHLDVQLVNVGKDVYAFTDLSIKTLLVGPLNLDFKAFVLCNLIRMELIKVPRGCMDAFDLFFFFII